MTSGYIRESPNKTGMNFVLTDVKVKEIDDDMVLVGNYVKNMGYSVNTTMENGELETILEMPYDYIVEMICDWWAFSWAKGNLYEIFNWYAEHSEFMKLAPRTRETVEDILDKIKNRLDSLEVEHSGVKGMKWGVRNGPPYPIKDNGRVATVQKHGTIKTTKIPREKFTEYALNPDKAPNKARAFKSALGYTKDNADELINSINEHFDVTKLEERGDGGYGMRYQQIMKLKGPNEKEANVLTAWIDDGNDGIKIKTRFGDRFAGAGSFAKIEPGWQITTR